MGAVVPDVDIVLAWSHGGADGAETGSGGELDDLDVATTAGGAALGLDLEPACNHPRGGARSRSAQAENRSVQEEKPHADATVAASVGSTE